MGLEFFMLTSAALRAARQIFYSITRGLRGPEPRAFFCHATKEGKNALKGSEPLENPRMY